jgi:hypothetical protein
VRPQRKMSEIDDELRFRDLERPRLEEEKIKFGVLKTSRLTQLNAHTFLDF